MRIIQSYERRIMGKAYSWLARRCQSLPIDPDMTAGLAGQEQGVS
jgi:hypothetical protein